MSPGLAVGDHSTVDRGRTAPAVACTARALAVASRDPAATASRDPAMATLPGLAAASRDHALAAPPVAPPGRALAPPG